MDRNQLPRMVPAATPVSLTSSSSFIQSKMPVKSDFAELLSGANQVELMEFREFLKDQYSAENLSFWLEVEEFRASQTPKELQKRAIAMWAKYFQPESPYELNVPDVMKRELQEKILQKKFDENMFNNIQNSILHLMADDCFPKFLASDRYKDLKAPNAANRKRPPLRHTSSLALLHNHIERKRSIENSIETLSLTMDVAHKEGFLYCLSRSSWKRRWFDIKDGVLSMYDTKKARRDVASGQTSSQKLKDMIPLSKSNISRFKPDKLDFAFELKTPLKSIMLKAESDADMNDWMDMIRKQQFMVSGLSEKIETGSVTFKRPEKGVLSSPRTSMMKDSPEKTPAPIAVHSNESPPLYLNNTELSSFRNPVTISENSDISKGKDRSDSIYIDYSKERPEPAQDNFYSAFKSPEEAMLSAFGNTGTSVPWHSFTKILERVLAESPSKINKLESLLVKNGILQKEDWLHFVKWFSPIIVWNDYMTPNASSSFAIDFSSEDSGQLGYSFGEVVDIVSPLWFFIDVPREKLRTVLTENGSFLFRFSSKGIGTYTLSVMNVDKDIGNWRINSKKFSSRVPPVFELQGKTYSSLNEIIRHFSENPLESIEDRSFKKVFLLKPADRIKTPV